MRNSTPKTEGNLYGSEQRRMESIRQLISKLALRGRDLDWVC
jgi:hypothetical protein